MRDPVAGQTSLVIVGASGMVGGYALRYSLDNPGIGVVTVIGRKELGISHPKLKEVLHQDFTDCSALAQPLTGQDPTIFCLGVYTGAVPDVPTRSPLQLFGFRYTMRQFRPKLIGEVRLVQSIINFDEVGPRVLKIPDTWIRLFHQNTLAADRARFGLRVPTNRLSTEVFAESLKWPRIDGFDSTADPVRWVTKGWAL